METFLEILSFGVVSGTLKAFFFFPMMVEERNVAIEVFVDQKMKKFNKPANEKFIRNILRWLEDTNYSEFVLKESGLSDLQLELARLESSYIDFLSMSLKEVPKTLEELNQIGDLIFRNESYFLQIARLRMIIDPEIQLSRNIHKKTNILYMKVKGFWLNDEGVKERKFFKSLGKFDTYPNGIEDENAILEGRRKIREVMLSEYSKTYK
jgi:hypothetical protein